jgi:hypothetical protein
MTPVLLLGKEKSQPVNYRPPLLIPDNFDMLPPLKPS